MHSATILTTLEIEKYLLLSLQETLFIWTSNLTPESMDTSRNLTLLGFSALLLLSENTIFGVVSSFGRSLLKEDVIVRNFFQQETVKALLKSNSPIIITLLKAVYYA